jgi:hypothetical protein
MFAIPPVGTRPSGEVALRLAANAGLIGATAPVAAVTAIDPATGHEEAGSAAALQARLAGRSIPAVVLERLDDTRGLVDIGGTRVPVSARLPLPGATVLLRFAAPAAAPAANAAANPAALPAAAPAPAGAASVSLGGIARLLSDVSEGGAAPLQLGELPASVETPGPWARALAGAVRDSGVFYESHLERWSRGDYPLAQLRREPQARPTDAAPAAPPAGSHGAADTPAAASLTREAVQAAGAAGTGDGTRAVDTPRPILREQLDLLENRSLAVSVDAWPGQRVDLEIRDERESRGGGAPAESAWSTSVGLDLPHIGRLDTELTLVGNRLRLVIRADAATVTRCERNSGALAAALGAAGVTLHSLRIRHDADA